QRESAASGRGRAGGLRRAEGAGHSVDPNRDRVHLESRRRAEAQERSDPDAVRPVDPRRDQALLREQSAARADQSLKLVLDLQPEVGVGRGVGDTEEQGGIPDDRLLPAERDLPESSRAELVLLLVPGRKVVPASGLAKALRTEFEGRCPPVLHLPLVAEERAVALTARVMLVSSG